MAVDSDIRTLLVGTSAITDIVGSTGVYVQTAGQDDLSAYVVVSQQGNSPNGSLTETTGVETWEVDIDCFANTQPLARSVSDAVSSAFKDYTGLTGSTRIRAVNWLDESSDEVTSQDADTVHYWVITQTFLVHSSQES